MNSTAKSNEARYALPECVVPSCSSVEVFTSLPSSQEPFKPTGFSIPDEIARHLIITDIKIGKNSQIVSTDCFPASLFAESKKTSEYLNIDRMIDHMELRLSVTNTANKSVKFSGTVIGRHGDERSLGQLICGLGWILVKGNKFYLRVQPQVMIVPNRLFVPDHVLRHFVVDSLKIRPYSHGYRTQDGVYPCNKGPTSATVPASMLTNKNLRDRGEIHLEPRSQVNPSDFICLEITNKSKKPQWFSGAVLGIVS